AINVVNAPIFSGNAFLDPAAQAAITAAPGLAQGNFSSLACAVGAGACFLTVPNALGMPQQEQDVKSPSLKFGFTATVFEDWNLNGTYVYGKVHNAASESNEITQQRLFAALDAVRDGAG